MKLREVLSRSAIGSVRRRRSELCSSRSRIVEVGGDKIINLCVYLVQKFSGKRNNENFNDFLRMFASPSTCRVCAFGAGGMGEAWVGKSPEEQTAREGTSSPFPSHFLEIIIAPLTAARFARFYVSLSSLLLLPPPCALFLSRRPLISFRDNCVYGTTCELQDFVIPWSCGPFVETSGETGVHPRSRNSRVLMCFSVRRMDFVMKCMF